jgi:hypothetical protein
LEKTLDNLKFIDYYGYSQRNLDIPSGKMRKENRKELQKSRTFGVMKA